ncbi:MAG: hypothetical protein ABI685_09080 [Ferruginibacter sp.]
MKRLSIFVITMLSFHFSFAQDWKKTATQFTVEQDNKEEEVILDVPANVTNGPSYVLFEKGKSSLTIDYEIDDEPNLTVKKCIDGNNTDLFKYANEIPDKTLTGNSDITISNKKVAAKMQTINGLQTLVITYDYKKFIASANYTETGKAVMYLVKATGTSLIYANAHPFIIRLKFNYQQDGGESLAKLGTEIINTLKKAED